MKTIAFVDASNLFYGGEKSLGWKIDYEKLLMYLREKYHIEKAYYFCGVEIHKFVFDYLSNDSVPIIELERYLVELVKNKGNIFNKAMLVLLARHLQRVRFYLKFRLKMYEK